MLGLESRAQRAEEDVTAIVPTVVETRDDVRWLKRAVQVLLDHNGFSVAPDSDDLQRTGEGHRGAER